MRFAFSKHALEQMKIRRIPQRLVEKILANPGEIKNEVGKKIYQSIVDKHLIRIFVNHRKKPNVVITVYRTSKIRKYYET